MLFTTCSSDLEEEERSFESSQLELLESSGNDAALVLLVDAICILELDQPPAGDELDAGRKSRDLDDTPAAHLLERMILKSQRSFPEHSIRSVERVLILERLCVSSRDLCWVG